MSQVIFEVPKQPSLGSVTTFVKDMWAAPQADEYIFDFSNLGFILPHGLLILSSQIEQFIERRTDSQFSAICPNDNEAVSYAAHMGFFKACHFMYGKEPGQALGGPNYIPIERIDRFELLEDAEQRACNVNELIINRARHIATTLTQRDEKDSLTDALAYSIKEIIRNSVEHSESRHIDYCAQYWPKNDRVQFAVVDVGVGLANSLSRNPHLAINTDQEAIEHSIQPGISGAMYEGLESDDDNDFENTGFGLFVTSQLGKKFGAFYLCSGTHGIKIAKRGSKQYNTMHSGTFVSLTLNKPRDTHLGDHIDRLVKEGEAIAEKKDDKRIKKASKSSRMTW